MAAGMNDFNQQIIEKFRNNDGRVGGMFEGAPMLLLHTTGAKSGDERVNPLMYRPDGEAWVIFASYAGSPKHPAWFHNLVADPDVTIEVGTDTLDLRARVTDGEERTRIWEAQKRDAPGFAEYEEKAAGREIPVVALERR